MNRWDSVGYTLNGFWCSVLFDTKEEPGVVRRFDGMIQCKSPGMFPLLLNPHLRSMRHPDKPAVMRPPDYATVVMHSPMGLETGWS